MCWRREGQILLPAAALQSFRFLDASMRSELSGEDMLPFNKWGN